jgi:hypothetical protein
MQQIGGECPKGWINMECERPSNDHVATSEGKWIIPVETKSEKLKKVIIEYSTVVESLKNQTVAAIMVDGTDKDAKLLKIREGLAMIKTEYLTKVAAIKAGEL